MSEQRFALDACRAVLRELDRQLSEGAPTTDEERDHCVWLSTACLILADAAIKHRDSTPAPTPKPAPAPDAKADHEAVRRRVLDNIKRDILREAAEKPVVEVCQFDCWVNGSLDLCEPDDDGDAITTGTRYELLRSLSPNMPVRVLVHPDCDGAEVARILRKIADDVERMESREASR